MLKRWFGLVKDPSFHLIVVTTAILGMMLAYSTPQPLKHGSRTLKHPPNCHACSVWSAEAAAAHDAFLIRTGCIAPDDVSE